MEVPTGVSGGFTTGYLLSSLRLGKAGPHANTRFVSRIQDKPTCTSNADLKERVKALLDLIRRPSAPAEP